MAVSTRRQRPRSAPTSGLFENDWGLASPLYHSKQPDMPIAQRHGFHLGSASCSTRRLDDISGCINDASRATKPSTIRVPVAAPPSYNAAQTIASATTVSLNTSAVKARLNCSELVVPSPEWLDRAAHVYDNRMKEVVDGYVLPTLFFEDTPSEASVFTAP